MSNSIIELNGKKYASKSVALSIPFDVDVVNGENDMHSASQTINNPLLSNQLFFGHVVIPDRYGYSDNYDLLLLDEFDNNFDRWIRLKLNVGFNYDGLLFNRIFVNTEIARLDFFPLRFMFVGLILTELKEE